MFEPISFILFSAVRTKFRTKVRTKVRPKRLRQEVFFLINKGKFIVFEGIDGSGTTTQLSLLKQWTTAHPHSLGDAFFTQEPTEGPVGLLLRQILSKKIKAPDEKTMALLFAADRADHQQTVTDQLNQGVHVFSDRYLLTSLAYQALSVDRQWIQTVNTYAREPDLTFLLLVPVEEAGRRRLKTRNQEELYETSDFLRQAQAEYERLAEQAQQTQNKPIKIIRAHDSADSVFQSILNQLIPFLSYTGEHLNLP
jgi:dTMP kinase